MPDPRHPPAPPPAQPADQITTLPDLGVPAQTQFAGYASIRAQPGGPDDEALFYWFAGTADYKNSPTILWSNGGPGSSSFWGLFIENGPFVFNEDKGGSFRIANNPDGWNQVANYLVFEHPLGVTLSFAKDEKHLPQNVKQGIDQLYQALLNFIRLHPEIAANPLILAGESYAGTYLPLLAEAILAGNQVPGNPVLDLQTVVLADAWVDPMTQMATDTSYALNHGLITPEQKQALDADYAHNYPQINQAIQQLCGLYMANTAQTEDPPFQPVLDYINRADVRAAIHAPAEPVVTESWSAAIGNLYAFGVNDSYLGTVQKLLDGGLQFIIVSGLNDAKDCNFLGTGAWLRRLQGDSAAAFQRAPTQQWKDDPQGPVLGFIQDGDSLSWIKVLNAGHLAAHDQPRLIGVLHKLSRAWSLHAKNPETGQPD
ncbi:S10 family serine carboxypeptidase-like protein [Uliginosibacterium aquaticum]|uniref:Carboxypeptidase n=1 Tax=Uliginosibacterium aquaticum TaxID=2731212 RepID=A0ABX2IGJ9_9RHOO|nr:hypothetical protein [Uliginosibacterium aquaticum]NSL53453.1 hypothetical protein [Uliginosibacterium aquaticum]